MMKIETTAPVMSAAQQAMERIARIEANFQNYQARQGQRDAIQAQLTAVQATADAVIGKHEQCMEIKERIDAKVKRGPV